MNKKMISNTVKFAFPPGSQRPDWVEIAGFLKTLDSDLMTMEAVYKMATDRSLCIKYKSEAAMQEALQRNKDGIKFLYTSGRSVELRMLMAGVDVHYVRIFDIPPEVDDKELLLALGKYGNIHRAVREKFPTGLGLDHLYTGVRGVYMEVNNDIPPALDVAKWKAKIYYDGLKEKCFHCQLEGHMRSACPTARLTEKRTQVRSQNVTYAGIVEAGTTARPSGTDVIDGEIIEIVEEEILEPQMLMEAEEEKTGMKQKEATAGKFDQFSEEQLKEIDQAAEQLGLENFRENISKLSDMIDALPSQPSQGKDQASQRRAQFATSGSTELRPKKSARKNNK